MITKDKHYLQSRIENLYQEELQYFNTDKKVFIFEESTSPKFIDDKGTIEFNTSSKSVDEFISLIGIELFDYYEGTLLDNYMLYTSNVIINGYNRDYILIEGTYLNEWSNGIRVRLTNDNKLAGQFLDKVDEYYDSMEDDCCE